MGKHIYALFFAGLEDLLQPDTRLFLEHNVFLLPLELAFDGEQFFGLKYSMDNWVRQSARQQFKWPIRHDVLRKQECLIAGLQDKCVVDRFKAASYADRWRAVQTADTSELLHCLKDNDVAILHFSGHGSYDQKASDDSFLALFTERTWSRLSIEIWSNRGGILPA